MINVFESPEIKAKTGSIAVFSCYFGDHEPLNLNSLGEWSDADKYIFTDIPNLIYPGATVIHLESYGLPAQILSRRPKIRPHKYFQNHDWVIYIDNRATLTVSPLDIVLQIEDSTTDEEQKGRFLFAHPERNCIYNEIKACLTLGKLGESEAARLLSVLKKEKYPPNAGLFVNTIMIERMGCKTTDRFNDLWYEMTLGFCHRDQISLAYSMWISGHMPTVLDVEYSRFIDWPIYSDEQRHLFQNGQSA